MYRQEDDPAIYRLAWIGAPARALAGARRPRGGRVLQVLHWATLGFLAARFPDGEGELTQAELHELFEEYHPRTPSRILAELRRAGLISYETDRKRKAVRVSAPVAIQPALPLETDPGSESRSESTTESRSESRSESKSESRSESTQTSVLPPVPPRTHVRKDSLLGDRSTESGREETRRDPPARAREATGDSGHAAAGRLLDGLRERRQLVAGTARLPDQELRLSAEVLAAGGTLSGLDEAIAAYRARLGACGAPAGDRGWRYVLSTWKNDAHARASFETSAAGPATRAPRAGHAVPPNAPPAPAPGGPGNGPPPARLAPAAIAIAPKLSKEALWAELDRRQRASGYRHISEIAGGGCPRSGPRPGRGRRG